jgi:hypothetical protein
MPLSQNPLVAAMQKFIVDKRQAGADARMAGEVPSGLRSFLTPQFAQDFFDSQLSFETKVGREADARKSVDHIVKTSLLASSTMLRAGLLFRPGCRRRFRRSFVVR